MLQVISAESSAVVFFEISWLLQLVSGGQAAMLGITVLAESPTHAYILYILTQELLWSLLLS